MEESKAQENIFGSALKRYLLNKSCVPNKCCFYRHQKIKTMSDIFFLIFFFLLNTE